MTDRWGDPSGAIPTTHIFKPAITGLDDHDLNEHLCLETARTIGLHAAPSAVQTFGDERAIVVERYDRRRGPDGTVRRIHQEDMCQALGTPPTSKYENEGGPSATQIIDLLRREVRPTRVRGQIIQQFVDALGFNWIIGGTDAHAKNYSVLISARQVRLAQVTARADRCLAALAR